ncbi:MAG: LysR family transcriptional regulator [Deltaproteobacteria bacterium]|nr:LysR family transcriptional regulator [Deltaproteobacteria bacterium]
MLATLNYHHLHYFWVTAGRGTLTGAARELRVSPSTISTQLKLLEEQLGEALFARHGRRLVLTEMGRVVQSYADQIFVLGQELTHAVNARGGGSRRRCVVGISDAVPKLVALRLLEPAFRLSEELRFVLEERTPEELFAGLAAHRLDVVVHDAPVPPGSPLRAYNHLLGKSEVELFAAPALAARLRPDFPRSLHDAPVVLPARPSSLRASVDRWLADAGVHPRVRAEVEDSALLKVLGQAGLGAFPAQAAIREEVERVYGVRSVGVLTGVEERTWVISVERRVRHPAVVAMVAAGRGELFA